MRLIVKQKVLYIKINVDSLKTKFEIFAAEIKEKLIELCLLVIDFTLYRNVKDLNFAEGISKFRDGLSVGERQAFSKVLAKAFESQQ